MDIRVLRHFVAVVQEEGISAAADVLRMSQPALSRQMKELEEGLGVQLFVRGNRGRSISLTKEGRVFYRRARQIIELADPRTRGSAYARRSRRRCAHHRGGNRGHELRGPRCGAHPYTLPAREFRPA